ncbi:hypothetical protein GWK47_054612 [Chionoecetes opilio]|uniref:Uncharacterized protein n=1 Tax=Chionoecetes opilio TaxID=41210 RepID=A0A8J4XYA4_CHIOP|nr:hypothetical protein GWK47_054612 [Chionoecetes opilio]
MRQLEIYEVDVVGTGPWKQYQRINQRERGKGVRRKVEARPRSRAIWPFFLRTPKKVELSISYQIRCTIPSRRKERFCNIWTSVFAWPDTRSRHGPTKRQTQEFGPLQDALESGCTTCGYAPWILTFLSPHREFHFYPARPGDIWVPFGVQEFLFLQSMPSVVSGQREVHSATSVPQLTGWIRLLLFLEREKGFGKQGGLYEVQTLSTSSFKHPHEKSRGFPGVPDVERSRVFNMTSPALGVGEKQGERNFSAKKKQNMENFPPKNQRPSLQHQACSVPGGIWKNLHQANKDPNC